MGTLYEQIANKCIYFNGLMNKQCEKGILYDSVKEKDVRPVKLPCLLNIKMNGGNCSYVKFPNKSDIKNQVEEIQNQGKKIMTAYSVIKNHYRKTGKIKGKIKCPECKGELHYTIATTNEHIWAKCSKCDIGWME